MGEVVDTLTMKKKKKGRPSLLDLQKRALDQQQLLQQKLDDPHEDLRSGFRNPYSLNPSPNSDSRRNSNSDDAEDERRDKKHRPLHRLNSNAHRHSSNFKYERSNSDADASISRQKIGATVHREK